jgi:hypothetical protein
MMESIRFGHDTGAPAISLSSMRMSSDNRKPKGQKRQRNVVNVRRRSGSDKRNKCNGRRLSVRQ